MSLLLVEVPSFSRLASKAAAPHHHCSHRRIHNLLNPWIINATTNSFRLNAHMCSIYTHTLIVHPSILWLSYPNDRIGTVVAVCMSEKGKIDDDRINHCVVCLSFLLFLMSSYSDLIQKISTQEIVELSSTITSSSISLSTHLNRLCKMLIRRLLNCICRERKTRASKNLFYFLLYRLVTKEIAHPE